MRISISYIFLQIIAKELFCWQQNGAIAWRKLMVFFSLYSCFSFYTTQHPVLATKTLYIKTIIINMLLTYPLVKEFYFFFLSCMHFGQYHFPFGFVVKPTHAKWNHSIGHYVNNIRR